MAAAGLAAGAAAGTVWAGTAPAGAGPTAVRGWQAATQAAAAASTAAGEATAAAPADITGAQRLRILSVLLRENVVDTGQRGSSGGDYGVFEERLLNARGERIGHDSARCMQMLRSFRCEATFSLDGRGSIEVSGTFRRGNEPLAVTGGTGDFRNARGQVRIVGGDEEHTEFLFALLP